MLYWKFGAYIATIIPIDRGEDMRNHSRRILAQLMDGMCRWTELLVQHESIDRCKGVG